MCTHTLAPRPKLTCPAPTRLLILRVWPTWWMSGPPTTQPFCVGYVTQQCWQGRAPHAKLYGNTASYNEGHFIWEKQEIRGSVFARMNPPLTLWQTHDHLEVRDLESAIFASGLRTFEAITWAINAIWLITLKLQENCIMTMAIGWYHHKNVHSSR